MMVDCSPARCARPGRNAEASGFFVRQGLLLLVGMLLAVTSVLAEPLLLLRTSGQEANPVKFDPGNPARPGFSEELIRALERVDHQLHFLGQNQMRPLRRIEADLTSGRMDVFIGLVRSPAREARFIVLSAPVLYTQTTQLAVRMADPIHVASFAAVRKLRGRGVIAVPQGSAYVELLRQQGGLQVDDGAESILSCLQKLLLGRVRFVYYGGVELARYLQAEGLANRIRLLPARLSSGAVCVVLSRHAPPQLRRRLQRALQHLQRDGTLTALRQKYQLDP